MKLLTTFLSAAILLLCLDQAEAQKKASPPAADKRKSLQIKAKDSIFLKVCRGGKSAGKAAFHTVQKLKEYVGQSDCLAAFERLHLYPFIVLRFKEITDLSPLSDFREIIDLSLGGNSIKNIKPLAKLTKLRRLSLGGLMGGNLVGDITPLANMKDLTELYINRNKVSDLSALKDLPRLEILNISRNQIKDLEPLRKLYTLQELHAWNNQLASIKALENMTNLIELNLNHNHLSDISTIARLRRLKQVWLRGNKLTLAHLSPLSGLPELELLLLENNSFKMKDIPKSLQVLVNNG